MSNFDPRIPRETFEDHVNYHVKAQLLAKDDQLAAKDAEIKRLRSALSEVGMLLNEIRARDGTAYHDQRHTSGFTSYRSEHDFNRLVNQAREALGGDILVAYWATHKPEPPNVT
jgi:hypothetical protein